MRHTPDFLIQFPSFLRIVVNLRLNYQLGIFASVFPFIIEKIKFVAEERRRRECGDGII